MVQTVDGYRIWVIMSTGEIKTFDVVDNPRFDLWGLLETNYIDEHWEMIEIMDWKKIKIKTTLFDE